MSRKVTPKSGIGNTIRTHGGDGMAGALKRRDLPAEFVIYPFLFGFFSYMLVGNALISMAAALFGLLFAVELKYRGG